MHADVLYQRQMLLHYTNEIPTNLTALQQRKDHIARSAVMVEQLRMHS